MSVVPRPSGCADRRSQERQIMILRVALLEQAGNPFFCLARNVSAAGIQVKLYSSAARVGPVVVRVADEAPIAGQIVWVENGNAGISFDGGIDPAALLRLQQNLSPIRRRTTPRVNAKAYAALHMGGRIIHAMLRDISCTGARVTTSRPLQIGDRASVRFPDLPALTAYVRWTERFESGLVFETPIPMQVIGQWIDGRLRVTV
jgi:hypothetical protein